MNENARNYTARHLTEPARYPRMGPARYARMVLDGCRGVPMELP
jgi:hypothetical protein